MPDAEQDARPDVAAGEVRAQGVGAARWLERGEEVGVVARVAREGREQRGEDGRQREDDHDGEADRQPGADGDVAQGPTGRGHRGAHRPASRRRGSMTGRARSTTRFAARYARATKIVVPAIAGASRAAIESTA